MYNTNATSLRKDLFKLLEQTVKYNEMINVSTKEGNAIILSEEEYRGLCATAEIMSNRKLYKDILEARKETEDLMVAESEVNW